MGKGRGFKLFTSWADREALTEYLLPSGKELFGDWCAAAMEYQTGVKFEHMADSWRRSLSTLWPIPFPV